MFVDASDEQAVAAALQAHSIHPEELERLLALGRVDETVGAEMLAVARQGWPVTWLMDDPDDATLLTTRCAHLEAIELERRVAGGIGATGVSKYRRLFIGCTRVDATLDADAVHVNVLSEDMRFPAEGPRVLIDGTTIPLPNGLVDACEGMHIPYFVPDTELLLREVSRVLKSGGVLNFAPSTPDFLEVERLLIGIGFQNVISTGPARRTRYRGRATYPANVLHAEKH